MDVQIEIHSDIADVTDSKEANISELISSPTEPVVSPNVETPNLLLDVLNSLDDDEYECKACTFVQPKSNMICEICETPNEQFEEAKDQMTWACPTCTFIQPNTETMCTMCMTPNAHARNADTGERYWSDDVLRLEEEGHSAMVGARFRDWMEQHVHNSNRGAVDPPIEVKNFFCDICMEDKPETQKTVTVCDHAYCYSCMVEFVAVEISEGRVESMTCPGALDNGRLCDAPLGRRDIMRIIASDEDEKRRVDLTERYERFLKLKSDGGWVECSKCNFLQKGNRHRPVMVCSREGCGQEFCFFHSGAHVGQTCREYRRANKAKFKQDRAFIADSSIPCPNVCCRSPIYKVSGCNHMTCPQCGSHFCYLCGGYVLGGLHYASFNKLGCPDKQFTPTSRPMTESSCERDVRTCVGWPLILLLCICPLSCFGSLFLLAESLWAVSLIICCPCIVIYGKLLSTAINHPSADGHRVDPRAMTAFKQRVCCGPVLCGMFFRYCGCGMPCACCMRNKWLCPDLHDF